MHKLPGKKSAGKVATLKYDGGAQLDLALAEDGKLTVKLASVPADVKGVVVEMLIPIAFKQGGTWENRRCRSAFSQG